MHVLKPMLLLSDMTWQPQSHILSNIQEPISNLPSSSIVLSESELQGVSDDNSTAVFLIKDAEYLSMISIRHYINYIYINIIYD